MIIRDVRERFFPPEGGQALSWERWDVPIPQYYSQVVLRLKISETNATRLYLGIPNGGLGDHCHRTTLFFRQFVLTQKLWIPVVVRLVCQSQARVLLFRVCSLLRSSSSFPEKRH